MTTMNETLNARIAKIPAVILAAIKLQKADLDYCTDLECAKLGIPEGFGIVNYFAGGVWLVKMNESACFSEFEKITQILKYAQSNRDAGIEAAHYDDTMSSYDDALSDDCDCDARPFSDAQLEAQYN